MASSERVLHIQGLHKAFGSLEAVNNLSLEVHRGEVFGLLGPNGAGKTTAIRMICGLLQRDAGTVEVDGVDTNRNLPELRRRIGLCPQELVIWDSLTCLEQLTFLGTQYDIPGKEARQRARRVLASLGLAEKESQKARTLSGGMKRRLNLALALVHDPEILVLDEPQAGLDPQSRILVREYIRSLARDRTVILTTHEMDEADRLADRIGIMDRGRILVVDTPKALKMNHAGGEVLEISVDPVHGELLAAFRPRLPESVDPLDCPVGSMRITGPGLHHLIPGLLGELAGAGIPLQDLSLRPPTLEDVFISLTGRRLRE